ncbi:MAG: NAD(+) diphosphatase [Paraprevotella sp.]|nr:NAD(+) diphosphatase [Paraprevotella sp.]
MERKTLEKPAYWFVFCGDELLLEHHEDNTYTVPYGQEPQVKLSEWHTVHRLTPLGEIECRAVRIDAPVTDEECCEMIGLRASYDVLPLDFYLKAGKGAEILYWDRNTKYCGVCGAEMRLHTDISKRCTNCGKEVWPQLATAIIVLVRKEDSILLVHAHNLRGKYYGLVAGFVETGETLEECVRRELMEEVSVKVKNIRYFGSQPWPYPCGLMVGFHADYAEGELHLQTSEIAYGGWFDRNHLPDIPGKVSMARMLIDAWLENRLPE